MSACVRLRSFRAPNAGGCVFPPNPQDDLPVPQRPGRLLPGRQFVWIDHHKPSLEQLGPAMAAVPGEREDGTAACVLTWRTFFPGRPVPRAGPLIGDRGARGRAPP